MVSNLAKTIKKLEKKLIEEGMRTMILEQLEEKFGSIPEEYLHKIEKAKREQLRQIARGIFTLEKIEDIDKYLK